MSSSEVRKKASRSIIVPISEEWHKSLTYEPQKDDFKELEEKEYDLCLNNPFGGKPIHIDNNNNWINECKGLDTQKEGGMGRLGVGKRYFKCEFS